MLLYINLALSSLILFRFLYHPFQDSKQLSGRPSNTTCIYSLVFDIQLSLSATMPEAYVPPHSKTPEIITDRLLTKLTVYGSRNHDNYSTAARKGSPSPPVSQRKGQKSSGPFRGGENVMPGPEESNAAQQEQDLIGFGSQFNTPTFV